MLQLASLLSNDTTHALGTPEEATALIGKAAQLIPPQDAAAQLALATVYEETGRTTDAIAAAQNAMRVARDAGNRRLIDAVRERLVRLEASALQPGP